MSKLTHKCSYQSKHANLPAYSIGSHPPVECRSKSLSSPPKQRSVDSIDNRLSADHTSAKVSAVESFNGVLASLDAVEFQVDVALGICI